LLALVGLSVVFGMLLPGPTLRAATAPKPRSVKAFMTLYGYADNSPPGRAIAHPCLHKVAGGTGTFKDPITFATDVREVRWCQKIYVPYMKRYFIHEDECVECDHDWAKLRKYRFDMWIGGDSASAHNPERAALFKCESTWTRANAINDVHNPIITINPKAGLPVTTARIFSPPTSCWKKQS
jgi:hypothetical protein